MLNGVLIAKTNFIPQLRVKLGIEKSAQLTTNDYLQLMLTFQQRMDESVPDGSVVFLGDSITQSLAVGAITPYAVNYGIGGLTTDGLLYAIPYYRSSLTRSDTIVIAVGINDFFNEIHRDLSNRFRKIVKNLPPGKPLIVSAILPVKIPENATFSAADIALANQAIRSECEARTQCFHVDISHALADEHGQIHPEYYLGDGIHLNPAGYRLWIQHLTHALKATHAR